MQSTQHKHRLYLRTPNCALVRLAKTEVLEVFSFSLFQKAEKIPSPRVRAVLQEVLEAKRVRSLEVVFGQEFGFEEDYEILNRKPLRALFAFEIETHTSLLLRDYTWHYLLLGRSQDRIRLRGLGLEKAWLRSLMEICQAVDVYLCSVRKETAKKRLDRDLALAERQENQPACIQPSDTKLIEFLSITERIFFWLQAYRRVIFILLAVLCGLMGGFNYKLVKTLGDLRSTTADAQIFNETLYAFEKDREYYTSRIQDLESIIDYQLQIARYQAYWPRILSALQDSLYTVGHAWLERLEVKPVASSPALEVDIQGNFFEKAESQQRLSYESNSPSELKLEKLITLLSKDHRIEAVRKSSCYPKPDGTIGFDLRLIVPQP